MLPGHDDDVRADTAGSGELEMRMNGGSSAAPASCCRGFLPVEVVQRRGCGALKDARVVDGEAVNPAP